MNCEKIQRWLASDYLDGEIDGRRKHMISEHLARCSACSAVEQELLAQKAGFKEIRRVQPPEHLWKNIREAVVNERLEEEHARTGFLARLKQAFRPKLVPVYSFAGMILILAVAVFMAGKTRYLDQANGDSVEYSLQQENLIYDLGTSVEEYFL